MHVICGVCDILGWREGEGGDGELRERRKRNVGSLEDKRDPRNGWLNRRKLGIFPRDI